MAIKNYVFDYDFGKALANFQVDTEKFTKEMANATLEFFTWEYDKKADPVDEVMKKYALKAIQMATENYHNTLGVISDFKNAEGFGEVDGSIGITLTKVELFEFDPDDLDMTVK